MTQISNPPAFPQAGTRSKSKALVIVVAVAAALVLGAAAVSKAHAHAPRRAMEMTTPPPSYADAMHQAEAEDMAKGVTPEMAATLRAKGSVDDATKPVQAGQI